MIIPGQTFINNVTGKEMTIDELGKNSKKRIKAICDYCGEEIETEYKVYNISCDKHNGKYCCRKCSAHNKEIQIEKSNKTKATCVERYGVENSMQLNTIKEKQKNTLESKYGKGVTHPSKIPGVLEKTKQTNLEKYGVEHYSKTQEFIDRTKSTSKEKYGVTNYMKTSEGKEKYQNSIKSKYGEDWYFMTEEFKEKSKTSYFDKTGYLHPTQNPKTQSKRWDTLTKENSLPESKQEKEIFSIISKNYPNSIKNYKVDSFMFDIYLEINDKKIDIECDGSHWHSLDSQKDRTRDEINKRKGYYIFRIRYDDQIPDAEYILSNLSKFIESDKKFMRI